MFSIGSTRFRLRFFVACLLTCGLLASACGSGDDGQTTADISVTADGDAAIATEDVLVPS